MKNFSLTKLQRWLLIILSIFFSASMLGALAALRNTGVSADVVNQPLSRYLYYGDLTTVNGVDGYIITGFEYHETDGDFGTEDNPAVIPAQFNGYPIIGIADGVFGGANSIKHITFNRITDAQGAGELAYEGESLEERAAAFNRMPKECQAIGTAVRQFGHNVFAASDIETITLPGSLADQGDGTFFNCTKLRWVGSFDSATGATVQDMSLLPYLKNFGSKCFMFDNNMKDVVLPDYTLGENTTQYYPEGKGLVEIGDTCFYLTTAKNAQFIIPASATKMIEDPFDGLKNVTSVYVKGDAGTYEDYPWGFDRKIVSFNGLNTSNNGTFYYNTDKRILGPLMPTKSGNIIVPISASGVSQFVGLAPGTFAGIKSDSDSATTITFVDGWKDVLKELPSACFKNSSKITTVTKLPDSIEKIGTMAFLNCSGLTKVGTTSHDAANTINIPSSCTTIGFWAFRATKETTVNIWATASASKFLVSQAAFTGNASLTSVNFKNLTEGTPRQIGNLKERPEEESIWNEKTFPFGAIANASCEITYSRNGGDASTSEAATISCTASVTGTWRCIVLSDDDGNPTHDVQIVRTDGVTKTGTLTIPSTVTYNRQTYNVVKVGNPNGNNDGRTFTSVSYSKLIFPEGVKEIGYMVVSGSIGTAVDTATWTRLNTPITGEDPTSVAAEKQRLADKEAQAKVVNLQLPSTLTKIDDWAFRGVTINSALHLPENLQYIGLRSFENTVDETTNPKLSETEREAKRTHIFNTTLVMPAYLSYIHVSAFANVQAPQLTDIYYMQYRTRESDKTFSRGDGKYMQFSGKNSSSSAGSTGIKDKKGGTSPTVHYMDDYTPYVYEIGAADPEGTDRENYLPAVSHATDKGNHAYDMPTDNPVFATPKEVKDPVLGTVSGYVADIRFGVRMMTQANVIHSVQMQNNGKVTQAIEQDTKLGQNTLTDSAKDFYFAFLDGVVPQGDYVFKIDYEDQDLKAAVLENELPKYTDNTAYFNTYFSVHIDIYASVKFQHALTETIGGVLPGNMSEDATGRALLKSAQRGYTEEVGDGFTYASEVTASDGDGIISTVKLPQPTFNHQAAEFIGWTTDRTIGGQVWIGEPAEDQYTEIGEDFTVSLDQLDENDQITVYSVFRLKLNKTTSYDWDYGDRPDGDFYQPQDSVAAGTFTMFRQGSDGVWRAEQVVTVAAGQLGVAFNANFNNETHAGTWRVLQGDQTTAWEAAKGDGKDAAFESFCNGLYGDGTSYDISEFTVDKLEITPTVYSVEEPYGSHIYGKYTGEYKDDFTSIEEYLYGNDSTGRSFITASLPAGQTNQDAFTIMLSGAGMDTTEPAPHVGTKLTYTVSVKVDTESGIEDYIISGGTTSGKYTVTPRALALNIELVRNLPESGGTQTLTASVGSDGVNTYTWTYYGKQGYESIKVAPSDIQPASGGFVFGDNADAAFGTYVPSFDINNVKAGPYSIYVRLTEAADSHINKDYKVTLINNTTVRETDDAAGYLAARVTINKLQITSPTFQEMYFGTQITAATLQSEIATHATVVVPEGTNELSKTYWDKARINQLLGRDDAAEDTVAPTIYTMGAPIENGTHHSDKAAEGLANPQNYWYAGTYVAPFTFTDATNYAWQDTASVDRAVSSKLNANFVISKAVLLLTANQNRVVYYNGKNYYDTFDSPGGQREKGLVQVTIHEGQGSQAALQIWGGQGSGPSTNTWSQRVFNYDGSSTKSLINAGTYTYHFELQGDGITNFVIFDTPVASPEGQSEWKNITNISAEIDYVIKKAQFKLELTEGLSPDAVYYDGSDKAAGLFDAHFKLTNINAKGDYQYAVPAYNGDENIHGYRVTYRPSTTPTGFGATTAVDAGFYVLIVQLQGVNATNNVEFVAGTSYSLTSTTQITWSDAYKGDTTMAGYTGTAPNGTVLAIKPAEIKVTVDSADRYFQNVAYTVADIVKLASNGNGKIDNLTPSDYTIALTDFNPVNEAYTSETAYPENAYSLLHAGTYSFSVTLSNGTNANTTNNYRFVANSGVYTVDGDTSAADKITSKEKADGSFQIEIKPASVEGRSTAVATREYTGSETPLSLIVVLTSGTNNPRFVVPSQSDEDGYGWLISVDGADAQKASGVTIKDVGKYTITIGLYGSAANDYDAGKWELVYEITKAAISVRDLASKVYNGEEQEPDVSITADATVTAGAEGDYTLKYDIVSSTNAKLGTSGKPLNAGQYTVTFKLTEQGQKNLAIRNETGAEKSLTFTITPALLTIETGTESYTYDGQPHQKVHGTDGDHIILSNTANESVLPEESGYNITYQYTGWSSNYRPVTTEEFVNAGTYQVTVTLSDKNYLFSTGSRADYSFTYTIEAATLALDDGNTTLTFIEGVSLAGTTLSASKDGVFQYKMADWEPLDEVHYKLNGADHKLTLTDKTEYSVSYSNNRAVGEATVTIRGLNNYTGSITLTFTITAKSLGGGNKADGDTGTRTDGDWGANTKAEGITVADVNGWVYSASAYPVSPTVTYEASGTTGSLVSDKDMTVTFWQKQGDSWTKVDGSSITDAGTYRVLVEGIGNYTDALYEEFTVTPSLVVLKPDSALTYSYDRNAHQVGVTFSSTSVTPTESDYDLAYTYVSDYFNAEQHGDYTNAGLYTIEVTLTSGNFAWDNDHTHWTNFYRDTQNTAPADATTGLFHYTDGAEHVTINFEITKAKVSVSGLEGVTFNREVQLPTVTFRNSVNGSVLPELGKEWGYWFEATNKWQKINMAFARPEQNFTGIPSHADEYKAYIVLLENGRGNFEILDAEGGKVENTVSVITGYPIKDGKVDNETLSKGISNDLKYEKQVTPDEELKEGVLYETTFTVAQLDILLRQETSNVTYDYDFTLTEDEASDEGEAIARQGRHTNDALAISFLNLRGNAEVDDVPYRLYVYRMDALGYYLKADGTRYEEQGGDKGAAAAMEGEPFLVFHYTLHQAEGNFVHFGACTPECDSSTGEAATHKHIHFTYEDDGKVKYTGDALTNHSEQIQQLREAFTNAGKFDLYVVLDNCSYNIQGGAVPLEGFKPDCYQDTCACKIMERFTFEIAQATITPYLFDSNTDPSGNTPLEGSALQITYDGVSHRLWVWFTNNSGNSALPESRTPAGRVDDLTARNYYAQFAYDGWAGNFTSSSQVQTGTHDYKDVGKYTVNIALKETGNFRLSGGGYSTTIVYNINARELQLSDTLLTFTFSEDSDKKEGSLDRTNAKINGHYVYISAQWEPVASVRYNSNKLTLVADGKGDYTLSYNNNINASENAAVTIAGANNYSGTVTLKFTISPKSLGTGTFNEEDPEGKNDSEITETQLTAAGFVYTGTQLNYTTSFGYDPKGVSKNLVSMTMGADYDRKLYKQVGDSWTEQTQVVGAGKYRLVATGKGNYKDTYVVEFTVDKATVRVVEPNNLTFNRAEQPLPYITFTNVDEGNSVVPTLGEYIVAYSVSSDVENNNAKLVNNNPFNAGTYDVTVTLNSENFQFAEGKNEETVQFVIDQLGVFATQMVREANYNGTSHFKGDIYGATEPRYGGNGAWTFSFSSVTNTDVKGIGYTITYTWTDGTKHTVVVTLGGYEKGKPESLLKDSFTLDGEVSDWGAISALGLFTNVNWDEGITPYTFTLGFADGNYKFESGSETESFEFTVTPAIVTLDNIESKVYNAQEQTPNITFSLLYGNSGGLTKEIANSELAGKFTLQYRVSGSGDFGDIKLIDVNKYDVEVTVANHNYAFDRTGTAVSTQTFEITPLDINKVTDFEVTIPDKVYSGKAITNALTEVEVTVGDKVITFKQKATADNEIELTEDWFKIIAYQNNTHVGRAGVTIAAGGNFTGNRTELDGFNIVARNIIVRIANRSSVYGQDVTVSSVQNDGWTVVDPSEYSSYTSSGFDWNWEDDWSNVESNPNHYVVFSSDSLGIELGINGGKNSKGGALLVGTYSISDHSAHIAGNSDYNITFVGDWEGEDEYSGKAGVYTVTPREIVLTIGDLSYQYGTYDQAAIEAGGMLNKETLLSAVSAHDSYTGAAILDADKNFLFNGITLSIVHNGRWSAGTNKWLNAGAYAIIAKYVVENTLSTYYIDGAAGESYNVGEQYKITLAGNFTGEGDYGEDSGFEIGGGLPYNGHAGIFQVTAREITITITNIKHEYNGEEPAQDELKWTLKAGSSLVDGDEESILGVNLTKDPGVDVGFYSVNGAYTESGSYIVIFENSVNAVEITRRKVTVMLKPQSSVYGEEETVGSEEGENWTAALSSGSTYKEGEAIVTPSGTDVKDDLNIRITKALGANVGKYNLEAAYTNNNYDVTFVGQENGYEITKRNIIIEIGDKSSAYGETLNISDVLGEVWSVVEDETQYSSSTLTKNWTGTALYNNENLGVKLRIASEDYTGTSSVLKVKDGGYAIIVDGSSLNPNYNFYFKGAWEGDGSYAGGDAPMSGEYSGHAGKYTVERRAIVIRPTDASSIYGDELLTAINSGLTWTATSDYAGSAILSGDLEALSSCIKLALVTKEGDIRSSSGYLGAGSYAIKGEFAEHDNAVCNNYFVTFEGTWTGGENNGEAGTYTVNKRDVTVTIKHGVMKFEYDGVDHTTDILAFGTTYGDTTNADGWTAETVFSVSLVEGDTIELLGIDLAKAEGTSVGLWSVTATANGQDGVLDYNVTFDGATQAVEITQRQIVVHIHDQYAVYGEAETVNQEMGTGAGDKAWHATFATESMYASTSGSAIVAEDDLNLTLIKNFGAAVSEVGYAIYGTYTNSNYKVTFDGNFKGEGQYSDRTTYAGHAGTYYIVARKIAVEILDQHNTYGETPSLSTAQEVAWRLYEGTFKPAYTESVGKVNDNTLVNSDNLGFVFTTDATSITNAGESCDITVTYNNPNYDVTFYYGDDRLSPTGDGEATAAGALITDKRAISITLQGVTVKYGEIPEGAKLYHYENDGHGGHDELLIGNEMGKDWIARSALSGNGAAIVNGDNLVLVIGIWYYDTETLVGKPYAASIYVAEADKCYVYARLATEEDQEATSEDGKFSGLGANANYDIMVVGNPAFPNDNRDPNGIYTITSGGTKYTSGAATLTIEKRNVTVTPESQEVEYGTEYAEKSIKWTTGGDGYFEADRADFERLGEVRFETEPEKSTSGHIKVGVYTLVLEPITNEQLPARANYNITLAEGTYTVTPKAITVQITDESGQYTGTRPTGLETMTLTDTDGLLEGDVVLVARAVMANADGTWNAGKYPIQGTVMGDDRENYTVTLTGDWTATGGEGTFAEASNGRNGVYEITPIAITVEFLKQSPVYGSQSATATTNYLAISSIGWRVASGNMVVGETLTFGVEILDAHYFASYYILAGTYNVELTYRQNKNYTITFKYNGGEITPVGESLTIEGAFEVQKREITVRINDQGHIYDGNEGSVANDYTVVSVTNDTGEAVVMYNGARDNLAITLSKATGVNAGTYAITGTCGNENYTVTWQGSWAGGDANEAKAGTYTISKKAITVQIGDQGSTFAGKSAEYALAQNGGHWSVVGDALVAADKAGDRFSVTLSIVNSDGVWHATSYAIKGEVGGTSKDNYEVTFSGSWGGSDEYLGKAGIYTISPLVLTITLKDQESVYNGAEPTALNVKYGASEAWVFTASALATLGGLFTDTDLDGTPIDDVLQLVLNKEFGVNVAQYTITLAGWDNGDYELTVENKENEAYSITPRPVTVTINGQQGVYGSDLAVNQLQGVGYTVEEATDVSGLVGSDNLNITIALAEATDKSTSGQYKVGWYDLIVTYNNENYTVTFKGDNSNLSEMPGYSANTGSAIEEGTIPNAFYVEKRQILVTIYDQSSTYDSTLCGTLTGDAPAQGRGTAWAALSSINGVGDAIIGSDALDITISTVASPIDAGKYYLIGALGTDGDSENYEVVFTGSWTDGELKLPEDYTKIKIGEHTNGAGTFTIDPAALTLTITAQTHEYDGTVGTIGSEKDVNWSVTVGTIYERDNAYFATFTLSRTDSNVHVGNYALSYAYTGENNNYTITYVTDDAYFRITPRRIAVQIMDQEKFYDSQAVVLDQESTGWAATLHGTSTYKEGTAIVSGDDLQITLQTTHIDFNAGKYPILATCGNSDYEVVAWTGDWDNSSNPGNAFGVEDGAAGTYTVNPRNVTVQILPQSSVYGDPVNPNSLKDSAWKDISESGEGYGILNIETLIITISLVAQPNDKYNNRNAATGSLIVGTYALRVVYDYNPNYIVTFVAGDAKTPLTVTDSTDYTAEAADLFTVEARQIRITLTQQRHEYDGTDGAEDLINTAFVLGVATNALTTEALAQGDDWATVAAIQAGLGLTISRTTHGVNAGKYELQATITNGNYAITCENAADAFEIYARRITITIENQSDVYSGKNKPHIAQQGGDWWYVSDGSFVAGDEETFEVLLSIVNEGNWEVNGYPIIGTVTAGNGNNNYEVIFSGNWTGAQYNLTAGVYTITAKDITVTIEDRESVYGEDENALTWTIRDTDLADGDNREDLGVNLTKEAGINAGAYPITGTASGKNYNVTFTGNWAEEGENKGTAGVYTITPRPVTVTVYSQSGVYGGNQDKSIDSTQYTAWDVTDGNVLERDSLDITIHIVFGEGNISALGKQLNAGWYSIEVTYKNYNYKVTFECEHRILTTDDNVTEEDVDGHPIEGTAEASTYTVENGYRIYPRRLEITVADQADDYKGTNVEPTVKQKNELPDAWRATNVLNGSKPPFVTGAEEAAFGVTLKLESRDKWNAGTYQIIGEVTNDVDKNNYAIDRIQNGTFTIRQLNVTVTVEKQDYAVYNGTDWAIDFLAKTQTVAQYADNGYWTATGVLEGDQALFAKAIQLNLLGVAVNANTYSASGAWRDDADADIKTNYAVTYEGSSVFTVNKRQLSVAIKDATSVYGEDESALSIEGITCTNDGTTTRSQGSINGDNLGITLVKAGGTAVGDYAITGSWNNNSNYEVTFTGSWKGEDNKGQAGTYTITARKLTVHVNDQGGVFGGRTYTNLSQQQGEDETNGGWYVVGFTDTTGISRHSQDTNNYIIVGDNLLIVLTLNNDMSSEDYAGTMRHSGTYKIFGRSDNPNYTVTFVGSFGESAVGKHDGKYGTYTITQREITVVIEDSGSIYGEALKENSEFGWHVGGGLGLAEGDDRAVLNVVLTLNGRGTVKDAGKYYNISASYGNADYLVTFVSADGKEENGLYTVSPRPITINIHDAASDYGTYFEDDDFNASIAQGYDLSSKTTLAEGETIDVLGLRFRKAFGSDVGKYVIIGSWDNPNYDVEFEGSWAELSDYVHLEYLGHAGTYEIFRAENALDPSFLLTEMNEGDSPDESLVTPVSKFGTVVVTYWRDEAKTQQFVGELSELAAGTYYVTVTVEATLNYYGINEDFSFRVVDSFGVVNNGLDILPYILIWSLQVPILAAALIFARKKKERAPEGE